MNILIEQHLKKKNNQNRLTKKFGTKDYLSTVKKEEIE